MRKRLGIRNEKLVLWVARMYPTKDPLVFIRAIPHVLKNCRKVKFLMKGGGPFYSYMVHTAEKLNLLGRYLEIINTYIPERQLAQFYAAADIFVVTSWYEGFGMTCIEAMACGKPVIATNDGAFPEVIGNCGLLFERSNARDLAEKIIALLENEELAYKFGKKASQRVSRCFTWEQAAEKYYQVYSSIS
jgi:glycosyltransferase involved in cell wall biosynthesis